MKNIQLSVLFIVIGLLSCNSSKSETSTDKGADSFAASTSIKQVAEDTVGRNPPAAEPRNGSDSHYFFANDALCQTLRIKKVGVDKSNKIPKELEFKLTLRDKLNKNAVKEFNGVAKLFSSEESFYDESDSNSADYFAADYIYKSKNYEIQIRLDIEGYEASVVNITTKQPEVVLGGYATYLKTFPNQGIMKRGSCTN